MNLSVLYELCCLYERCTTFTFHTMSSIQRQAYNLDVHVRLLKLSTACKFPLHGPLNYFDWLWEMPASCSVRNFFISHQILLLHVFLIKPLCLVWNLGLVICWILTCFKSEVDFCRLCGFVFRDKRRKRNVGEFAKMFEEVVGVKVMEGDKHAVCNTCRYRVDKSWKSGSRYFCSH